MKKLMKSMILIGVILFITTVLFIVTDSFNLFGLDRVMIEADNANWSETETGAPGDPGEMEELENTYTIVEIVPYKGLGEMGYLVGGEEPIDLDLLPWGQVGLLGPVDKALTLYRTYQEDSINGTLSPGWYRGRTASYQNGYFEWVDWNNGGSYQVSSSSSYAYVGQGNGDYQAALSTETSNRYNIYNVPTNNKNVNAYFVYGKPEGVALYSNTRYKPFIVEENQGHGDYDYNLEMECFVLNIGHGKYDVIFEEGGNKDQYYMMDDPELVYDNSGDYSFNLTYQRVEANQGAFVKVDASFTYQEGAPYRWVPSELVPPTPTITKVNNKITLAQIRGQAILLDYQFELGISIVNNEWLKRYALGIPANQTDNYKVEVITITPEELNLASNIGIIQKADIFYVNERMHNSMYINMYENYNYEGIAEDANYQGNSAQYSFAYDDLNWNCIDLIFKRLAGIDGPRASVVFDVGVYMNAVGNYPSSLKRSFPISAFPAAAALQDYNGYNNTATLSNVAKLYVMLYQRNITDFYNAFLREDTLSLFKIVGVTDARNPSGSTGCFVRPDQISTGLSQGQFDAAYEAAKNADVARYWNQLTFFPYIYNTATNSLDTASTNINTIFPNLNILQDTTDLHENMLIMNGREIFADGFASTVIAVGDAAEAERAVVHINSINEEGEYTNSLTIADFINVITNNGLGYESNDGISEDGEAGEDGTSGSNLRTYTSVLNIQPTADFVASESAIASLLGNHNVRIVNMTSSEFNGSIKNINTHYDMVYLGCGAGRFNYSGSGTVFNSANLNNSIYNKGDTVTTSEGSLQYTGNDITALKKEELTKFINAGYPIVVEDKIYRLTNVKSDTNMYSLITGLKSNSYFLNIANYYSSNLETKIKFLARLIAGLNTIRPMIKILQPTTQEEASLDYIYVDSVTKTLNIEFALRPGGILPSRYTYAAHLYLDRNGDGIFTDTEELTVESRDGSSWESIRESRYKAYLYQYDMSELNGVYQWKVLIIRNDNDNIRSEITGYAAISNKEDVNILHIRDNASAFSLEDMLHDTSSLIHKYGSDSSSSTANKMDDYKLNFTSLTVDAYEALYEGKQYTSETALSTNQLTNYHLVILDNPNDAISNTNGELTNIRDELGSKLGVVFTKGALGFANQTDYYPSTAYSFLSNYTYARLTRSATSGQYYVFNSLNTNGSLAADATYKTTYATKSNEGTVTRYPYSINPAIRIAQNSYSKHATIDLNNSFGNRLIGWYCLSDSRSPVVRAAGLVTDGTENDPNLFKGIYSSSPNDVKNNYYLFSNGGCYYSGIELNTADTAGNDNEIMLFINTLIAAGKSTGRVVSNPPVIEITDPEPEVDGDGNQFISIAPADIVDEEFVLIFEITNSSSAMEVAIQWNDLDAPGNWNERIYPVITGELATTPISIGSGNKNILNDTYAIKIPASILVDTNKLNITAENKQGNTASKEVTLRYSQNPTVTIQDPIPMLNSSGDQFLYVDVDYIPKDTTEAHLTNTDKLRLEVQISDSDLEVMLDLISGTDSILTDPTYDIKAYPIIDGVQDSEEIDLRTESVPQGNYALYLPLKLMKNINSREITITATNIHHNEGSTTVTLLRRSLFPYD